MFRFALSLVLLMAMSAAAVACPCSKDDKPCICDTGCPCEMTNAKADMAYGVKYTQDRVLVLPQDKDKFYLTIIGDPADPKYVALQEWLESVPELKAIKTQTHFNHIETTGLSEKMYKERYAATVPALPCIRVQAANGDRLFQLSGQKIPMTGEALSKAINTECLRRWRKNHPIEPTPNPDPVPDTDPAPGVEPTPDSPEPDPVSEFPWLGFFAAIAFAGVMGLGAGLVSKFNAQYRAPK